MLKADLQSISTYMSRVRRMRAKSNCSEYSFQIRYPNISPCSTVYLKAVGLRTLIPSLMGYTSPQNILPYSLTSLMCYQITTLITLPIYLILPTFTLLPGLTFEPIYLYNVLLSTLSSVPLCWRSHSEEQDFPFFRFLLEGGSVAIVPDFKNQLFTNEYLTTFQPQLGIRSAPLRKR